MDQSTILIFILSFLFMTIGYLGNRDEKFSYRVYLFVFMLPAGFFLGLGVIRALFPQLPELTQVLFTAAASLASGAMAMLGLFLIRKR